MSALHIALLGYGTVGKGVYKIIQTHQEKLKSIFKKDVKIVAILVKNIEKYHAPDRDVLLTDDYKKIVTLEKLDVVIDAIVGKEPSFYYLQQAIHKRMPCHNSKQRNVCLSWNSIKTVSQGARCNIGI